MARDELDIIAWLRQHVRQHDVKSGGPDSPRRSRLCLGIGDDMAIIESDEPRILLSSDMLLDGVHFDARTQPLDAIGRKAVACCLSDCAAMAVRPVACTVSVALPESMTLDHVKLLYGGIFAMAEQYDLALAGGDTTRWPQPLAIDVALIAEPYDGIEPVTRGGARVGDNLYVTGPLGGSLLGRHLIFAPRIRESCILARQLGDRLHAMMDISDGLSLDLWRMCEASGVGAILDENKLEAVISDDARSATKADSLSAIQHALSDGEDFELLLAVSGRIGPAEVSGVVLYPVGDVTASGLSLRTRDGRITPLEPRGYVH